MDTQNSLDSLRDAQIRIMPLSGITERFGLEGLGRRFALEIAELPLEDQYFCNRALYVALYLHKDDMYKGTPYGTHILRGGIRLIRDYGITDPEVIAADLLHDSVEDHSPEIAQHSTFLLPEESDEREQAFWFLENGFSPKTSQLVRGVTNLPSPEKATKAEKRRVYYEHIREGIAGSLGVFLIKLCDFTDNGVGIAWSEDPNRMLASAEKYLPVFDIFLEQINVYEKSGELNIQQVGVARRQLMAGKRRCELVLGHD